MSAAETKLPEGRSQGRTRPPHRRLGACVLAGLSMLLAAEATAEGLECVMLPHSVLELSSGVSGRLSSVYVDRADRVEAGQIVAELESDVERANLSLAQARAKMRSEVRLRESSLAFDERQRKRIGSLHARKVVSNQDKDQADRDATLGRWQLGLARERIEIAQLELDRARAQLALRTVRSPFTGVVLERYKSEGEYVDEDAILQVARLDPLRVEVIAPVEMHPKLRPGMQANVFSETSPETPRQATVTAVDPVADPASGTFRARMELPNPDHSLLAGVKCTAELIMHSASVTPVAPSTPSPTAAAMTADPPPLPEANPTPTVASDIAPETTAEATPSSSAEPVVETFAAAPTTPEPAATDAGADSPLALATPAPTAGPTPGLDPARAVSQPTSVPTVPETVAMPTPASALACQTIGPIDALTVARGVARQLRNAKFEVERREGTRNETNGYIVLASVEASDKSVRAATRRLKKEGVRDLAPLTRGPYKGRISLGVFEQPDHAQARIDDLAARGVRAEIEPRHRTLATWWLDVRVDAGPEQARLRRTVIDHLPALGLEPAACTPLTTAQR